MIRKIAIALCLAAVACSTAMAKSYRVERISVDALVEADAGLKIEEQIRYRFKGSYSFAYREFELKPGESIEAVRVSEDGSPYREVAEKVPGGYSVSREGNQVKVSWFFKARNETRTFALAYRLRGVVRAHPDTAELYYQFVGGGWSRPIGRVEAVVRFERPPDADSLKAWAHGPLHGDVRLPGDGTVRFTVSPLPSRTFWEGRVLFPVAAAPGAIQVSDEPALSRILAEEKAWAEEANRRRAQAAAERQRRQQLAEQLLPWSILAALAGALVWVFLFFLHGKPHPPQRSFSPGEPPGDLPPALVGYLMSRSVGGSAIAATLIDLARRGFLKIQETEKEKSGWFGSKKVSDYRVEKTGKSLSEAAQYERELVEFAFSAAGDGEGLWLSDFKKTAQKSRSRFLKWFGKWRKEVKELGRRKGFFEPYSASALAPNLACGIAVVGFGIYCTVASQSPVGVPAIVVGTLQSILSMALNRRTPEGQDLYRGWKKFKAHLKSIAKGLGPVSIDSEDWGRYLVAAIVLGQHRQLTKRLAVSPDPEAHRAMAWYVPHTGSQGLAGFGESVSGMVASIGSAVTSASGAGGGASAGGGGGSGGGGGGAG